MKQFTNDEWKDGLDLLNALYSEDPNYIFKKLMLSHSLLSRVERANLIMEIRLETKKCGSEIVFQTIHLFDRYFSSDKLIIGNGKEFLRLKEPGFTAYMALDSLIHKHVGHDDTKFWTKIFLQKKLIKYVQEDLEKKKEQIEMQKKTKKGSEPYLNIQLFEYISAFSMVLHHCWLESTEDEKGEKRAKLTKINIVMFIKDVE